MQRKGVTAVFLGVTEVTHGIPEKQSMTESTWNKAPIGC
jgi:hypothetical protein